MKPIKTCILLILLVSFFYACEEKTQKSQPAEKPNIILISADDLGWSDIGCLAVRYKRPTSTNWARAGCGLPNFTTLQSVFRRGHVC